MVDVARRLQRESSIPAFRTTVLPRSGRVQKRIIASLKANVIEIRIGLNSILSALRKYLGFPLSIFLGEVFAELPLEHELVTRVIIIL